MITILLALFSLTSPAAVLVEDNGVAVQQPQTSAPISRVRSARNGFEFRKTHRAGAGLTIGGALGAAGANIELNFSPENTLALGFGGGNTYSSFAFSWKRIISGKSLLPYASIGYARIFNRDTIDRSNKVSPEFLTEKLMAPGDLDDGEFAIDMLTPTLGVQYLQLGGDYEGLALGLEVNLLFSLQRFAAVPAGSFVSTFYF